MGYCTHCGKELRDGIRFCPRCRAPVRAAADTVSVGDDETVSEDMTTVPTEPEDSKDAPPSEEPVETQVIWGEERPAETPAQSTVSFGGLQAETLGPEASQATVSEDDALTGVEGRQGASIAGHRMRRGRIAAIAAGLALVACVAGGAIIWTHGGSWAPSQLESEAGEKAVSRVTRIIPRAADGTVPNHYYVRIKRAVDEGGNALDASAASELEVTGDDGFSPQDVIGDLPDGSYVFEIEADDETFELPPMDIVTPEGDDGQQENSDGVIMQAQPDDPANGDDSGKGEEDVKTADELFLDKINELEAAHGAPGLSVVSLQSANTPYVAHVSGLAFVRLLDFGDGVERLVTAYCDGNSSNPDELGYVVEVWTYDEATHALNSALGEEDGLCRIDLVENTTIDFTMAGGITYLRLFVPRDYISQPAIIYYGPTGSGRLGIAHEFASEYTSTGDLRCVVDGVEMSPAEYLEIEEDFLVHEAGDTFTSYSLSLGYDTAEDAGAGGATSYFPDVDGRHCPADSLETVEQARQLLQSRINAGTSGAVGNQTDADHLDVTGTEITESVELPTYSSGVTSDGTTAAAWGCLELSGSGLDPTLMSSLNKDFKNAFDLELRDAQAWAPGGDDGQCLLYRSALTCARDGFLGTRVEKNVTNWGPHGWTEVVGEVRDAQTGAPLAPWDVAGITSDELDALAVDAIESYVRNNPSDIIDSSSGDIRSEAEQCVENADYLVTNEGITIFLPEYSMGYAYAEGCREIVVWAFDDPSLVGTDVWPSYNLVAHDG